MNTLKILYLLGGILLFIGLLWMFLPHATHAAILGEEDEAEHYVHIIQGIIPTILGLILLLWYDKRENKNK